MKIIMAEAKKLRALLPQNLTGIEVLTMLSVVHTRYYCPDVTSTQEFIRKDCRKELLYNVNFILILQNECAVC